MTQFDRARNYLWEVQECLIRRGMTVTQSEVAIGSIWWYIITGRATAHWVELLMAQKPFMIARRVAIDGSADEVLGRVKEFLAGRE